MAAPRRTHLGGVLPGWALAALLLLVSCRGCGEAPQPRLFLDAGAASAPDVGPDASGEDAAGLDAGAAGEAPGDAASLLGGAGWRVREREAIGAAFIPSEAGSARLLAAGRGEVEEVLVREVRFESAQAASFWLRAQPSAHEAPLPLRRIVRGSVAWEVSGLGGAVEPLEAASAALEGR